MDDNIIARARGARLAHPGPLAARETRNGERTLREVIFASGLESLLALRLLVELFQSGVIAAR